jgi:hypothetical protein
VVNGEGFESRMSCAERDMVTTIRQGCCPPFDFTEDGNISQATELLRQVNEQHADAIANFRDKIQTADKTLE